MPLATIHPITIAIAPPTHLILIFSEYAQRVMFLHSRHLLTPQKQTNVVIDPPSCSALRVKDDGNDLVVIRWEKSGLEVSHKYEVKYCKLSLLFFVLWRSREELQSIFVRIALEWAHLTAG